ncbi:hypothetical protein P7M41_26910, partial [Vibrio parahaemolyticus]|nr:hypothetical protein [Vibrio parahaemolyticus]
KGLPYSQFLRARHICMRDDNFHLSAYKLFDQFLKRGYPRNILEQALCRASEKSRNELTNDKAKKQKTFSCVFNTTCSPLGYDICTVVKKHWNVLF